jgi:hypothetical protein
VSLRRTHALVAPRPHEATMTELETIMLQVAVDAATDQDEIDELTLRLRRELLELDVRGVDLPRGGEAPPDSKVGEVLAVGTLLVTLAKSVGAVDSIARTVRSWLHGHPERTVELAIGGDTIKVTGASSAEQDRLIDAWLERHAATERA